MLGVANLGQRMLDAWPFDPMDAFFEPLGDNLAFDRLEISKISRSRQFVSDLDDMRQTSIFVDHRILPLCRYARQFRKLPPSKSHSYGVMDDGQADSGWRT
jgi:hypothetical protein